MYKNISKYTLLPLAGLQEPIELIRITILRALASVTEKPKVVTFFPFRFPTMSVIRLPESAGFEDRRIFEKGDVSTSVTALRVL